MQSPTCSLPTSMLALVLTSAFLAVPILAGKPKLASRSDAYFDLSCSDRALNHGKKLDVGELHSAVARIFPNQVDKARSWLNGALTRLKHSSGKEASIALLGELLSRGLNRVEAHPESTRRVVGIVLTSVSTREQCDDLLRQLRQPGAWEDPALLLPFAATMVSTQTPLESGLSADFVPFADFDPQDPNDQRELATIVGYYSHLRFIEAERVGLPSLPAHTPELFKLVPGQELEEKPLALMKLAVASRICPREQILAMGFDEVDTLTGARRDGGLRGSFEIVSVSAKPDGTHCFHVRELVPKSNWETGALARLRQTVGRLLALKPEAEFGHLEVVLSNSQSNNLDWKSFLMEIALPGSPQTRQFAVAKAQLPITELSVDRYGFIIPAR